VPAGISSVDRGTAGTACPTWLLIKSVRWRARDSVASTSSISSLQAKPQSENPEFPCAWKQLPKFLPSEARDPIPFRPPSVRTPNPLVAPNPDG
jgi:hypothetical protein